MRSMVEGSFLFGAENPSTTLRVVPLPIVDGEDKRVPTLTGRTR